MMAYNAAHQMCAQEAVLHGAGASSLRRQVDREQVGTEPGTWVTNFPMRGDAYFLLTQQLLICQSIGRGFLHNIFHI